VRRKAFLVILLLIVGIIAPLAAIQTQGILDAGQNQQAKTGQTVNFNGTTTDNASTIVQVTWNFGDGSTSVNGSSATLLNTTVHTYSTAGVYNATLTVKFDSVLNKTETDNVTITVVQNLPPIANAGSDQIVEQTSQQGALVTLNGTGSSDPNNDTLTYNWKWTNGSATGVSPTALFPPGNTTATLTVSDGLLNATDTVLITVRDRTPPFVNAGPDLTVEQESHAGTQVTLIGNVTDAVSTQFNFTWSENGIILGTKQNLTYTFNLGTHIVTLNATDQAGNTGNDNVTVKVVDTRPPQLNITLTATTLWPPNHDYVQVNATVTTSDICDPSPKITLVSITSNEPDNGLGDGNTINDIIIVNNFTFNIRAERSGTGTGRNYTITYKATDASGNSAIATAKITVPHQN